MNTKIYDPKERNAFNLIQGTIGFKGLWNIKDGKVLGMEVHPCGDVIRQILSLKHLQAIRLTNGFTKIPEVICNHPNLKKLVCQRSNLTEIPVTVGNLKSLEVLVLSYNNIQTLPDSFYNLSELRVCSLFNNSIKEISPKIAKLRKLSTLCLDANPITHLPDEFLTLPLLHFLMLPHGFKISLKLEKYLKKIENNPCDNTQYYETRGD